MSLDHRGMLSARVAEDVGRNGDLIRSRDEYRHKQDTPKPITTTPTESVLGEAHRHVLGKRGAEYGHPLDNHGATAHMFAAYLQRKYDLRVPLDADDVCWFNIFQKGSRDANEPGRDHLVDTAGYAFNLELIRAERERRERAAD